MTRDEILALEAGPELNALVAVELMEWHRQEEAPDPYRCPEGGRDWISPDGKDWRCNHCGQEDGFPDVSGSISPAWEVLSKLDSMPFRWVLSSWHDRTGDVWHDCQIEKYLGAQDGWKQGGNSSEDTTPLAICRAALLAVMESDA